MSEPRTTSDPAGPVPGAARGPIPATGDPGVEAFGYHQELKRSLSFTDLLVYGLIFMVPIAPFGIFGSVFQASGGMVALAYAIGMVAMVFTAASYSQMSRAFPMAGSVYTYAGRGIAQPVGFIAGWMILLDYVLVPGLLYLIAAVAMNSHRARHPGLAVAGRRSSSSTRSSTTSASRSPRGSTRSCWSAELVVLAIFLVIGVVALAARQGQRASTSRRSTTATRSRWSWCSARSRSPC